MTITEFLTARLDEDEAVVVALRQRSGAGTRHGFPKWKAQLSGVGDPAEDHIGLSHERMLAEVEAKRRIVAVHGSREVASLDRATWAQSFTVCRRCWEGDRQVVAPCPTLRLLALPYADHPDYDEAWQV